MAFTADDRIRVTSEASIYRRRTGTVEVAAADAADGLNKVRLDGHPVGKTVNLADAEMTTTSHDAVVQY